MNGTGLDARLLAERERLVEEWRDCCRFASVSAESRPELFALADRLEARAAGIFDRVTRVEVPGYAPTLIAELDGDGPSRLLLYSHYDVQPAGPDAEWTVPPFAGQLVDGRLVARGCCDDKSDVAARLQAVEALVAEHGRPSFSIIWFCEGAEEIGSPCLRAVLTEHRERLAADGCLWESYLRRPDGRPEIAFGCRGILYVELRLRVAREDRHGVFASAYRSASVELVRALASIVGDGVRAGLDGFYDGLVPLDEAILDGLDAPQPEPGSDAAELLAAPGRAFGRRLLFEPSISIAGITTGYQGPGMKTIVPAEASAKLDLRLLPGQDPDDVLRKLRAHLDRRGFERIELTVLSAGKPAVSPARTPLAEEVLAASAEVLGRPVAYPVAGSGPMHHFVEELRVPVVMPAGTTRPDGAIHAPNEGAHVDDYVDHVRFTARLLERIHRRGGLA